MNKKIMTGAAVAIVAAGAIYLGLLRPDTTVAADNSAGKPMVDVTIPELTGAEKVGEQIFNAKCAVCHGAAAAGNEGAGPPLVHKIYEPGHHGDMSFMLAPRRGVRAHHWPFGDMPPIEGLTDGDLIQIIAYVRKLQRANGIN